MSGFTLVACFSQNKEELILEFNNSSRSFFIKASLLSHFCCLSFPAGFTRAKKNSVDLFSEIILKKVESVDSFENERCFAIQLQHAYLLLFKMHGNRANVLLVKENIVVGMFRNHLKADASLDVTKLNRPLDFSFAQFERVYPELPSYYFTLGKVVWEYWHRQHYNRLTVAEQWQQLNRIRKELESPTYYLGKQGDSILFSLLPVEDPIRQFTDPIEAITYFFHEFSALRTFQLERATQLKKIKDQISGTISYCQHTEQKLNDLVHDQHYHLWGDLIMAHLHRIMPGASSVTLPNFYNDHLITIKLKPDLNPQRNAELFYRKAKNQEIEIKQLRDSIARKKQELEILQTKLQHVLHATDLKSLRQTNDTKTPSKRITLPYHEFLFQGFKIWVGRNAESNDELTLKYGYKEDLWLHAKDVAGSHVLIKYQAGKNFPKEVIERAAQLAAYNSKRKTETLCPVIVTPKKFVRKRKGDPAGTVVVEREKVIMVEPKL